MIIAGLQKLTLLDYPGKVSCMIFVPGCNFRCPYCYNYKPLQNAKVLEEHEVFDFLKSRVGQLDGVVITGGEPTLQKDLKQFIHKIKDIGYKIKLDTNGTNPEILLDLILDNKIDYVAMDIKSSLNHYAVACGNPYVNIQNIKKSINVIMNTDIEYEFRTTVTSDVSIYDFEELCQQISNCNKYFIQVFKKTDDVLDKGCNPPTDTQIVMLQRVASKYINNVFIR